MCFLYTRKGVRAISKFIGMVVSGLVIAVFGGLILYFIIENIEEGNQRVQSENSADSPQESSTPHSEDSPSVATSAPDVPQAIALASINYINRNIEEIFGEWSISDRMRINTESSLNSFVGFTQKNTAMVMAYSNVATIDYFLDGNYTAFSGAFCLAFDTRTTNRTAKITVYGDGELLITSGDITGGYLPESFSVDVTDVVMLRIIFDFFPRHTNASTIGIGEAFLHR
jgi:hypothetical protein